MVDISIIIPTKNEEAHIGKLLSDILSQKTEKLEIEIIVCDGNSKDKTRQISKSYGAKVIDGGNHPGIGRNTGARIAKGKLFYMMDADVRIRDPHFIINSYNEFKTKELDSAIMPNHAIWETIKTQPHKKLVIHSSYEISNLLFMLFRRTKTPKAFGTCMIFKRSSFRKVGGFDENIYWAEDTEIAERMAKKGYEFGFLRSVYIEMSPRRALDHGMITYFWNAVKLELYRRTRGEVSSKELYQAITGREGYFTVTDKTEKSVKDAFTSLKKLFKNNRDLFRLNKK